MSGKLDGSVNDVPDGNSDYLHSTEPTNLEDALRAPWQNSAAKSNSLATFSPVVVMKNTVDEQDLPGRNTATVDGFQHVSIKKSSALYSAPMSSAPASRESESQLRNPVPPALCNPVVSGKELCSSSDLPSQQPSKSKRFQNTLVVLHKSGLLEITLKTKKLISQNQMTQVELDQLKQQTQLFMEALKNNAPQVWAELEASLMQSDKAMNSFLTYPDI